MIFTPTKLPNDTFLRIYPHHSMAYDYYLKVRYSKFLLFFFFINELAILGLISFRKNYRISLLVSITLLAGILFEIALNTDQVGDN